MKIDLDLIKKKSEHNEGLIEELEEISLHQLQIKKIEFLNTHCKNLKILLLQNNLIEKIENLNQLKKLEYLNLALNNITLIQNLEKCESLRKLDLTLNFIDVSAIEKSIYNLKKNENLRELYLMGNPCTSWENVKPFVVFHLEQLEVLDGCDILVSDKIKAKQSIVAVLESLENEKKKNEFNKKDRYDSIMNRKQIYEEIEKEEIEKGKKEYKTKNEERQIPSVYTDDGHIRQCNEGHYKFLFDEYSSKKYTFLKIFLPRYMCNSLINVDINVDYVRCIVKNKLFQIKLNDLVLTDFSKVSRKKYTGELHIKMRKKNYKKNKIFERDYFKSEHRHIGSDVTDVHSTSSSCSWVCSHSCSSSSISSDSSASSFFKKKYTFKENKRRSSTNSQLTLPNKREDSFFLEEKKTKYFSSFVDQVPSLEKIPKEKS
ncbi:leucine-rich repeat protein (LRR13) [Plasmodium ovale wallikeri]|uniref:Leucine-rich repeat protein (LRR13) n=2 Tax=Plasmodium ovale TaxID=36330 RepID=A0A1A8ZZ77_PLAOA|nr:leucine-rich repeat protein (LRR13) [Plasmodium ovale wallikeri]SBT49656.1 leucine-rich repeat protein (LRR13) [Plasmodium ovale wallikeri]SBT82612.1 leucine-rich repeat protein [Plasmodium ovale]